MGCSSTKAEPPDIPPRLSATKSKEDLTIEATQILETLPDPQLRIDQRFQEILASLRELKGELGGQRNFAANAEPCKVEFAGIFCY